MTFGTVISIVIGVGVVILYAHLAREAIFQAQYRFGYLIGFVAFVCLYAVLPFGILMVLSEIV